MNKIGICKRIFAFIKTALSRALYVFNVFLFLVLILQMCLGWIYFTTAEISLPDSIKSEIVKYVQSEGVDIEFSEATISCDLVVTLSDISARFVGTADDFVRVDKLRARFLLNDLIVGKINPKSLNIQNASFVPTYGDIENSPVIDSLYVNIRNNGDWINIDNAQMKILNIDVNLSGFINKKFKINDVFGGVFNSEDVENNADVSIKDIVERYDSVFENQDEFKKYTDIFTHPMIDIYLALYEGAENTAKLTVYSPKAITDLDGKEALIRDLKFQILYENAVGKDYISASLDGAHFYRKNFPSFDNFRATSAITVTKDNIALEKIDIDVKQIVYDGSQIGNVNFKKEHLDENNWRKDWQIYATLDTYRFGGDITFDDDDNISFNFDGCFDPDVVLKRPEFSNIEKLENLKFYHGINLKGYLNFNPNTKKTDVDMSVQTNDCVIVGIHADNISGKLRYSSDDNILSGTDVVVETKEGWNVTGQYHQNVSNNKYLILAQGQLRPMALSSFMAPWWDRVMGAFDFKGTQNFPIIDASVDGTWGDPEHIWCFVSAKGKDVLYSGADFSNFSLNVLVTPKQISLYDVFVKQEDRIAHGTIGWFYKNGITTFETQRLFFESNLNSIELEALGGRDAKSVLDVVKFKNAPRITINGLLYNDKNNPENKKDIFNVEAFANGETMIDRFSIENVSFFAKSDTVNTQISNLDFKFCSGNAKGDLDLIITKDDVLFDTSLTADNMNQLEFIDFLVSLGKSDKSNDKKSFTLKGAENGVVDLSIDLKGNLNDIQKSVGFGNAVVENDELMDLHLFGMLSRALNSLKLPFGAFELNYAQSNFVIENEYVKFDDLLLSGDVMQIEGSLIYHYMDDNLDGHLLVDPLEGWDTPIISDIAKVLTSLTSAVEIKLTKSISSPDISVSLKPLNVLKSDENIVKKIRESKNLKQKPQQ